MRWTFAVKAESLRGKSFRGGQIFFVFAELEDEHFSVRMKRAAGRGPGFFHRIVWKKMHRLFDEAGAAKSFLNVIAFGVDVRIDFVRDAVVAPIAFESDVVRRSADPNGLSVHLKWRFPDTQVIARCDHGNRLRVRPAVILRPAEKIKLAHWHRPVGFLRKAADDAVQDRVFYVGVNFYPTRRRKDALHAALRAKNQKIHHVAGVAVFVANAPWNLRKQSV